MTINSSCRSLILKEPGTWLLHQAPGSVENGHTNALGRELCTVVLHTLFRAALLLRQADRVSSSSSNRSKSRRVIAKSVGRFLDFLWTSHSPPCVIIPCQQIDH